MAIQSAIKKILAGESLSTDEMQTVMREIMHGQATPAQIGGLLVALRMKGESVEEIAAAATVMRELSTSVDVEHEHLVEIVGTGGDGSNTFNISTTSAFVVAAAGGRVAKHNNRSVSSRSGSADVLEAAGINLNLSPEQVADCVNTIGIGFMFAPLHHKAMKYAVGPRKELGVRTLFNLLGPLTNPARVPNMLMGVFSRSWVQPLAEVVQKMGGHHVMVVHSEDGLDEISISAPTHVAELYDGNIRCFQIKPEDFGFKIGDVQDITVDNVEESLLIMNEVLDNKSGVAKDIVILNAGAAIYTAGLADDLANGMEKAREAIASGTAKQNLTDLIAFTTDI